METPTLKFSTILLLKMIEACDIFMIECDVYIWIYLILIDCEQLIKISKNEINL